MKNKEAVDITSDHFRQDVINGLSKSVKQLQSKYFYDKAGDSLFQQIMALPEYYLTCCELDIFMNRTKELAQAIIADGSPFDLIELGAGDATKSAYLLKYLDSKNVDFNYMPIDISGNILSILKEKIGVEVPGLDVQSLEGDYFEMLEEAAVLSSRRKVVMLLGGNIGNMEMEEARNFCRTLKKSLRAGDITLIGFDLKKNPHVILQAYNDASGITAAFNLNLLHRINRELDANFDVRGFEHYQNYDPVTGACRSYLVSVSEQEVAIGDRNFSFGKDECIYMEVSQKFARADIQQLALFSGFESLTDITDSKGWFSDAIWIAK